jgi:hypothetical protein
MVNMGGVAERNQRVDVQKMLHGKSIRMARTSALVTLGPLAGPFVIVSPVDGSRISLGLPSGGFRGVRTMVPFAMWHANFVPGRSASLCLARCGSTICPLLERVVSMSYCLTVARERNS